MEIFGVGPAEVVVILIVALIFVGPERLPKLAADIARTIREIRKYTGSITAELTEVLHDFEKETAEDRGQWKEIGEGLTGATKSLTDALRGARTDAESTAAPAAAPAASPAQPAPPANGTAAPEPAWREVAEPAPAPAPADPSADGAASVAAPGAQEPR